MFFQRHLRDLSCMATGLFLACTLLFCPAMPMGAKVAPHACCKRHAANDVPSGHHSSPNPTPDNAREECPNQWFDKAAPVDIAAAERTLADEMESLYALSNPGYLGPDAPSESLFVRLRVLRL